MDFVFGLLYLSTLSRVSRSSWECGADWLTPVAAEPCARALLLRPDSTTVALLDWTMACRWWLERQFTDGSVGFRARVYRTCRRRRRGARVGSTKKSPRLMSATTGHASCGSASLLSTADNVRLYRSAKIARAIRQRTCLIHLFGNECVWLSMTMSGRDCYLPCNRRHVLYGLPRGRVIRCCSQKIAENHQHLRFVKTNTMNEKCQLHVATLPLALTLALAASSLSPLTSLPSLVVLTGAVTL